MPMYFDINIHVKNGTQMENSAINNAFQNSWNILWIFNSSHAKNIK